MGPSHEALLNYTLSPYTPKPQPLASHPCCLQPSRVPESEALDVPPALAEQLGAAAGLPAMHSHAARYTRFLKAMQFQSNAFQFGLGWQDLGTATHCFPYAPHKQIMRMLLRIRVRDQNPKLGYYQGKGPKP